MKHWSLREAGARPDVIVNAMGWGPELGLDRRNGYRHPVETLGEAALLLRRGPEMGEKGWFGRFVERAILALSLHH
jgi:hypothetical protein